MDLVKKEFDFSIFFRFSVKCGNSVFDFTYENTLIQLINGKHIWVRTNSSKLMCSSWFLV